MAGPNCGDARQIFDSRLHPQSLGRAANRQIGGASMISGKLTIYAAVCCLIIFILCSGIRADESSCETQLSCVAGEIWDQTASCYVSITFQRCDGSTAGLEEDCR